MKKMQKIKTRSNNSRDQDANRDFDLNTISNGVNENTTKTDENSIQGMNAYINALKLHKQKISAMVESIIETVDNAKEDNTEQICTREKITGKESKLEYGVPLTVEPMIVHDVSHIVIDTFRDHLCRELPGNKRKLFESQELKEHLSLIEDIRRAEKDVMEVQERLLRMDDKGGSYGLKPWNVENYSLLCPQAFDKNTNEEKENENDRKQATVSYGIHTELRQLRLHLNGVRPRSDVQCHKSKIVRTCPVVENPNEISLFVNTNIVRFKRFVPGGIYKKTITVINTGKRMTRFGLSTYGGDSNRAFVYEYAPRRQLASGMKAKITVTFKCTSLEDIYELLIITSSDGNNRTNVLVCGENAAPVLQYTAPGYEMDSCRNDEPTDHCSPSACVFECNACLVGGSKTITVTTRNIGRSARFVCVPEDVWYAKSVEDVEWNGSMRMGPFKITPSIFEINHGQSIDLKITFEPRLQSFYCSKFIIMSDNSCAQEVNVFGSGQMFGEDCNIQFEGYSLVQQLAAGPRSYVLNMGKIGKVVRYVYAKNMSRNKYPYRWTINHTIVDPGLKNAKVNFNIHPSAGWFDAVSRTMFEVECSVTDKMITEQLAGVYRVIATLMIDDVPKESISDLDAFFEVQEDKYSECITSRSSSELVSIKVAEIEVISEYEGKHRVSLRTDPVVLDLNWHKLEIGACVRETVHFINTGPGNVHVTWTPDDEHNDGPAAIAVAVDPDRFKVIDRTAVDVSVRPTRPGRFRRALGFRAVNCDRDVVVHVRGTAETAPEVDARPVAFASTVCTGVPCAYPVRFRVKSSGPFSVRRRLYAYDASGPLRPQADGVQTFGPYGGATADNGTATMTTLSFPTPVATQETGMISCQLAEWSFDGSKTVYTQAMTYAESPDVVKLNTKVVTIDASLYRGISHRHKGIRLLNNMQCDFAYSWGAPLGSDTNNMHCALEPTNGMVNGKGSVEFELVITPRTTGHLCDYWIPCFVQCDPLTPRQLRVECMVKEFSATIIYVDECDRQRTVEWREKVNQWTLEDDFDEIDEIENADYFESEYGSVTLAKSMSDFEEDNILQENIKPEKQQQQPTTERSFARLPGRDTFGRSPRAQDGGPRVSDRRDHCPVMAFKDVECNAAVEQHVTVRNNTGTVCRVRSRVRQTSPDGTSDAVGTGECAEFSSVGRKRCCKIWIEKDDEALSENEELKVSIWVLTTAWGRYEDTLSIELYVGDNVLPALRIPIVVQAVTAPLEFPLSANRRQPTVNFSLYSTDSEHRLQILNKSEIPIQVSWRMYNNSELNRPFGVVFDTITPNPPNLWSFRISQFYGLESPRYFKIEPNILKMGPNELGFVTLYLDRTTEISLNRDENNMVYGKAVGIVTALEPSEKYCIREDGFKLKPVVVKLCSETRHSIQPNLVLRELDNVFRISATQIYNSQSSCHTVTRLYTMLNLLRYPATVSFTVNSPFTVERLRSMRCGDCPGNTKIQIFYEDLLEIELQVNIDIRNVPVPKMPLKLTSRKATAEGRLFAHCENSYFKPKMVALFKAHIYFPILKLSTEYINFGEVFVRETKSMDVMLSSYPGPERFVASSKDDVFAISPGDGVVSHMPTSLTISFRPKAHKWYSNKIEISTTIPMDVIYLKVFGFGIEYS